MSKTINWGIMATGKIAHTFAKAVNAAEGARLYACASRDGEKAAAFAAEHGAEKSYGSYEELAADPNVDIVYVASPMSCHYENVKLCFERGKNVLCEKSITMDSEQLAELVKTAKKKDLFFMEAMWTKCLPSFLKAKEWVQAGKIGEIRALRADFSNPVDFDPRNRLFRSE
ncbi:MAG: Gfo/Idh/MocA family oxidoreductase, partial [Oscillospiraceae bacterium]|nr:Gfo/Idh/MocA family oxidoreductase [Oscillospiraceae bacterium]